MPVKGATMADKQEPTITINAHRWDRVEGAAKLAVHYQLASVDHGDLDEVKWDFHHDEIQVPNLAEIARYLADHPETVDALDRLWRDFDPSETPLFHVERTQLQDVRMLGEFVKAMRGETGE